MSRPNPPLKPTFVNERARVAEHDYLMADAQRLYGVPCCPDCYLPPAQCQHIKEKPGA